MIYTLNQNNYSALIFTLDSLVSWRRSKVEVEVEGFELRQSEVLELRNALVIVK